MKRAISFLLVLVMVMTLLPVSVFAAGGVATFAVGNASGEPGSTVDVDITVANNPGILSTTLSFTFDKGLTLISATPGKAFEALPHTFPAKLERGEPITGTARFMWQDSDITDAEIKDGVILTLTFALDENAEVNKDYKIAVECIDCYDRNTDDIATAVESGYVSIIDYTPGDVTADKNITTKDVIWISRYIVDGCTTDPEGYNVSFNELAADVTGDGAISTKDVIWISRYIVDGCMTDPDGYNVKLFPGLVKCAHEMETVPAKAATCTENGNIAYWHCNKCDKCFSDAAGKGRIALEDTAIASLGHIEIPDEGTPATTTVSGYTPGVWCDRCETWISGHEIIPVVTYEEFTITYDICNGDEYLESLQIINPNPTRGVIGEEIELQNDLHLAGKMTVPGYRFLGWYDLPAGTGAKRVTSVNKSMTLYAHWDRFQYEIHYNTGDADNKENEEKHSVYYVNTPTFSLATPKQLGFKFIGWKDDNGNYVSEIRQGSTGNIRLTPEFVNLRNIATPLFDGDINNYTLITNEEKNEFYFVYYLGIIDNVVVSDRNTPGTHSEGHGAELTASITETESRSVQAAISRTTSNTTSWQTVENVNVSVNAGVSVEKLISIGGTFSCGASMSHGGSDTTSTTNSYSETFSKSLSYSQSVKVSTNLEGYYRRVGICNLDVFAVIYYNAVENQYWLDTWSSVRGDLSEMWEYSEDGTFKEPEYELPFECPLKDEVNVITEKVVELIESSAKGLSAKVEGTTLCLDMRETQPMYNTSDFYYPWIKDGVLHLYPNIGGKQIDSVKISGAYDTTDNPLSPFSVKLCGDWGEDGVKIILDNIGVIVPDETGFIDLPDTLSDVDVTIEYIGQNEIIAHDATSELDAQCAIKANDLTIRSEDAEARLVIRGGNGMDGVSSGEDGTDGAAAIIADNLTVDTAGKLEVYGGNGGNGSFIVESKVGGNGSKAVLVNHLTITDESIVCFCAGSGGNASIKGSGADKYTGTIVGTLSKNQKGTDGKSLFATISTTSLSCKLDNGYNYTQVDPNSNNNHFSHNFEFGKFVVIGAEKDTDDQFKLTNGYNARVGFRMNYKWDALPLQDTMTARLVSNDGNTSPYYNLPWDVGSRSVKYGMIVALITYQDGSTKNVIIENAFYGKNKNDVIDIAVDIEQPCTISIAICYELQMWAPGILGISDDYHMNWRINQVIYCE